MNIMKLKYIILTLAVVIFTGCEQEIIELQQPGVPQALCTACPTGATAGTASFAKFVVLGNSYVTGFQGGALFNTGQANSMAKMIATQLACAGGGTTFNQPDINSVNGYNAQVSNPAGGLILGRMILFDADGTAGPGSAAPTPAGAPGVPAPYNTADFPGAFAGDKAALNNFGVPLVYLGQALVGATGGPASPANPAYNPWYARFASNPGTSTMVGDALTAGGSFYLIWMGIDDALLHAALGADGTYPITSTGDFSTQYNGMITTMLNANPLFKGVVGNIPSLSSFPYFTTIPWNTIKVDAPTATSLNTNMVAGYNAFLDGMVANTIITAGEATARKLKTYVAGQSAPVLLTDETLTDLSPYMAGPYAALLPYAKARHANEGQDLVPLGAGAVLGKPFMGNPAAVQGVSYPLGDQHMLTYSEIVSIETTIGGYNATIAAAVAASSDRLALADVKTAYATLLGASIANKGMVVDGVTIASSFAPPASTFSEDGLHPNTRGYAYTANVFINAINTKFGATVPNVCLNDKPGTALPINP